MLKKSKGGGGWLRGPGLGRIAAGLLLMLLAGAGIPALVAWQMLRRGEEALRFVAPGRVEVEVQEAGRYYLWHEHRTVFEGRSWNRDEALPDGLRIRVRDAQTGEALEFVPDMSISTSDMRGASRSIGYVKTRGPGRLEIVVEGQGAEAVLSFSRSRVLAFIGMVFGGIGLAMLLGLAGAALAAWGAWRLYQTRRAQGA